MMDMDNFKIINDTYGHHIGDIVLQKVVTTIQECLDYKDYLIRYGGDEFLLVCTDCHNKDFHQKLKTIKDKVQVLIIEEHPEIHLTLSIGAVSSLKDGNCPIEDADQYLYTAKKTKNTIIMK